MTISWKLVCLRRSRMILSCQLHSMSKSRRVELQSAYSARASAKALIFSWSRFVVGLSGELELTNMPIFIAHSSNAKTPQPCPKLSANASLMIILARTFCPAEHRPRMSSSTSFLTITTR